MRPRLRILVAVALLVLGAAPAAGARDRHHYDDWHDRRENRRDARRAAVVVGVTSAAITGAARSNRAERRYEDCLYATGYDYDCDRRRYEDQRRGRRASRRAGVAAGVAAYAIVRD